MPDLSTFARPLAVRQPRLGVPWATVVTLGAAMSLACAFWMVSIGGAIGSPERYETPFATCLMLSAVLMPVFGGVVVGSLALAMRWFGPVARGMRRVLLTALLLVAAGTLAGVLAIAASSAYDYILQLPHVGRGMGGMSSCTGGCVPREQHDIFVLHIRGVLLVGRWLLLTNAVLVAWLVALWGGRIRLSTGSSEAEGSADCQAREGRGRVGDVRRLLFGALLGAAVIHAAVIREHLGEWPSAGVFFLVLAVAELAVAGALLAGVPERVVVRAAVVVSAVPLVAWLWSRILGLPFGPEPGVAEAVGMADLLARVLEVTALLAALALTRHARLVRPALSAHQRALVVLALLAVTAFGFAATAPGWFDAFGVSTAASMEMSR